MSNAFELSCPIPIRDYPYVTLAHGGGGRLMHDLISKMFLAAFGGSERQSHDGAVLIPPTGARLAFTTDSYVVKPLFFPGGNIGELAVYGTANDLAMCGARACWLSLGLILEEGLPMATLWEVVQAIAAAAHRCGAIIVTGDTKVVDRGKGDGIYVNTAGVGVIEHDLEIEPLSLREGDAVVVNGDLGRHGIAIMAQREGLALETQIESDCSPLWPQVAVLLEAGIEVHCLRDLTRGGLSSALNELASASGHRIFVDETKIPVIPSVRAVCELLGFDPLYVACEGRFVAFVRADQAERAIELLRTAGAPKPEIIGHVQQKGTGEVILRSCIGTNRILDMLSGEQLPRIC
ncbi:MAG: hydrogenase expression/formation protein HypE [Candidatus Sumerlaeaceae bacterium]|jgi:hydrogenase expression/formation protein HypE